MKLLEGIQLAVAEGLDKEAIEKTFSELLAQKFYHNYQSLDKDLLASQTHEELAQLSMEDLLKG